MMIKLILDIMIGSIMLVMLGIVVLVSIVPILLILFLNPFFWSFIFITIVVVLTARNVEEIEGE